MIEIQQNEPNGLTAADLFCGAGVGAYGIKHAGFDIVYAVDNDTHAVRNYNRNIGNHAICADIRTIKGTDIPKVDLLVGTPVCKPFSVCGARRLTNDEKYGDLLAETLRLLEEVKPRAFLFENVGGLVMGDSLSVFNEFVYTIEQLGYRVYWSLLNCLDYGIPQERNRVILTAITTECENEFVVPETMLFGKKSMRDAIYDLKDKTINDVKNHNADFYKNFDNNMSVKHRQRGWDEPALTVISDMDSAQYYPEPTITKTMQFEDYPRRMSVRENLRLQTVGDDFYFDDETPLSEQYTRCSGVPSLLTYKWGNAIADCLLGKTEKLKTYAKTKKLF